MLYALLKLLTVRVFRIHNHSPLFDLNVNEPIDHMDVPVLIVQQGVE